MVRCCLPEAAKGTRNFSLIVANQMSGKFDKYWFKYNLYLLCSIILDSRWKVTFVEYGFSKCFGFDEAMGSVDEVLATLHFLYDEYKLHST